MSKNIYADAGLTVTAFVGPAELLGTPSASRMCLQFTPDHDDDYACLARTDVVRLAALLQVWLRETVPTTRSGE